RKIAHTEPDRVVEGSAVRVLAKCDRRSRVALVPALKRRWQHTERDGGHGRDLDLSRLEAQRAASVALRAFGVRHRGARLGQERLAGGGHPYTRRQTLQQRSAELVLEALDLLRERR